MSTKKSEPLALSDFADSLPEDYRSRFNPAEIAKHAHLVAQMKDSPFRVGRSSSRSPGMSGLCVCAEDRPGLLASIGATLSTLGYEVYAGEAYCFRSGDRRLALDLFWIVDPQGSIDETEVQVLSELLEEHLLGRQKPEARRVQSGVSDPEGTCVRFVENEHGNLSVLEVETPDRGGLLWAISHTLQESGVQIVGSHIRTRKGRVFDRFTLEDEYGHAISEEHRLVIQVAVLSAIQPI